MTQTATRWALALLFSAGLALFFAPVRRVLVTIDRVGLHEWGRGVYGRYIAQEDWQGLSSIPPGMNYDWMQLDSGGRAAPLRIGHALGASGTSLENKLAALPAAYAAHLPVLEVDIWLASDGALRCHHGPGDPGPLTAQGCTLERLLDESRGRVRYVMLDIKTDFATAVNAISNLVELRPDDRNRIIFQLYLPGDVSTFSKLRLAAEYPGPVITAYSSRSSLDSVIAGAHRAGVRAVTVPFDRRSALPERHPQIALFVHPIHRCEDLVEATKAGFAGVYTLSKLECN